jgi:hypothetical protein
VRAKALACRGGSGLKDGDLNGCSATHEVTKLPGAWTYQRQARAVESAEWRSAKRRAKRIKDEG